MQTQAEAKGVSLYDLYSNFLGRKTFELRKYLWEPFHTEYGLCFCNGHQMVIVNNMMSNEPAQIDVPQGVIDGVSRYVEEFKSVDRFFTGIKNWNPMDFACENCHGTGLEDTCCECYGAGTFSLESDYNEYTVSCKTCAGAQEKPKCSKCDGRGFGGYTLAQIGENYFQPMYIDNVQKLPGAKVSIPMDQQQNLYFKFDHGFGLVMPIRHDASRDTAHKVDLEP